MGWRRRAPLGRVRVGAPSCGGAFVWVRVRVGARPGGFGMSPSGAPKVHFPRQPTATPWEIVPKIFPALKGRPKRPPRRRSFAAAMLCGVPRWGVRVWGRGIPTALPWAGGGVPRWGGSVWVASVWVASVWGRVRVGARSCGWRTGWFGMSPSGAPKVHFPRQPTATPWETTPLKYSQPCKGVPDRPFERFHPSQKGAK
jgi:hypothetical protein